MEVMRLKAQQACHSARLKSRYYTVRQSTDWTDACVSDLMKQAVKGLVDLNPQHNDDLKTATHQKRSVNVN